MKIALSGGHYDGDVMNVPASLTVLELEVGEGISDSVLIYRKTTMTTEDNATVFVYEEPERC